MSEREFAGFASGEAVAPLPASLLRDAAPRMTDAAELLVTLYAVEALSRVRKFPRCLALSDLRGARPLVEALSGICGEREVAESFADGLRAAAARGTLLHERAQTGPAGNRAWGEWIALNSAEGRRALTSLGGSPVVAESPSSGPSPRAGNVGRLWREAFGTEAPGILRDEMIDAEARYPAEWLRDAFVEAAANEVRSWRYVRAILSRWEQEGHDDSPNQTVDRAVGPAGGGGRRSAFDHLIRE